MNAPAPGAPTRIAPLPNGELAIAWADGHESYLAGYALRCACACASCVDEVTGRRTLVPERVPPDVQIVELHPVGNYGIGVRWSDGHDTGIYTFERLRQLG